jgi:hypothetical protein
MDLTNSFDNLPCVSLIWLTKSLQCWTYSYILEQISAVDLNKSMSEQTCKALTIHRGISIYLGRSVLVRMIQKKRREVLFANPKTIWNKYKPNREYERSVGTLHHFFAIWTPSTAVAAGYNSPVRPTTSISKYNQEIIAQCQKTPVGRIFMLIILYVVLDTRYCLVSKTSSSHKLRYGFRHTNKGPSE